MTDASPRLVYIIGTYPSLTTTFVDREIAMLRRLGASVKVLSIRRSGKLLSDEQQERQREVTYLLPVSALALLREHVGIALSRPKAYFGTLLYLLTRKHPDLGSRWLTLLHFAEGVRATSLIAGHEIDHLHAHFIDRAATVALVASRLLGVPYSVTAHAFDIYVRPLILPEKVANAKFVATVSDYNVASLSRLCGGRFGDKLKCISLGLDLKMYCPGAEVETDLPVLLSVGRLTEKKGFSYLLRVCRILRERGLRFRCEIVGSGPLRDVLTADLAQLGLSDTVSLCGALPHPEVIERYRRAQVFVLPCVVGDDGDRDGTPTVLLEAMAMRLPVVSTSLSGIPEIVTDGVNGLLVPPGDERALADALEKLLRDPAARALLGERGRERVAADFDVERNVRRLLSEFTRSEAAPRRGLGERPVWNV